MLASKRRHVWKTRNGKVVLIFPLVAFEQALKRKERRVLKMTGGYGLKVYRSLTKKKRPAEPPKYTKTGRLSKRWVNWKNRLQRERPPFMVRGQLSQRSNFVVDERRGNVIIGPYKLQSNTRSAKPVPRLLDEGGRAIVRMGKRRRRRINVMYRPYPFRRPLWDKTLPVFKRNLAKVPLR